MSDSEDLPPSKRMRVDNESSDNTNDTSNRTRHTSNILELSEKATSIDFSVDISDISKLNVNKVPELFEDGSNIQMSSENSTNMFTDSTSKMEIDEKSQDSSGSLSQYKYVSQEELQKLREFQVLDEVNEEDSKDEDSDTSDKSEDLPDDEIEKMLEEDLPEGFKGAPKPKEKSYVTREKIVLQEKGINQFEVLPLDWMMVRHCSGMPVYMHRGTRVCTLAKPYFLGKGNTRRHDIPISAIPCLAYRKALEEEEKQKEIDKSIAEQIANGTWANNQNEQTLCKQNKEAPTLNGNQPISEKIDPMNIENNQATTFYNDQSSTQVDQSSAQNDQSTRQNYQSSAQNVEASTQNDPTGNGSEKLTNPIENQRLSIDQFDLPRQESIVQNSNNLTETQTDRSSSNSQEDLNSNEHTVASNNEPNYDSNKGECPFKDISSRKPVVLPGGIVMPPPRVETVNTSWKTQHLSAEQVNEYCQKLFKFKNVKIMHFKRWADRRKYVKARKTLQYPTLPEGTKLITIPAHNGHDNNGKATKRDWVMNMNGCSYLSVFHEYVRRALQKQPVYEFKQLENASTPYQATVYIGGMQYGVGHGSSKRAAKSAAARASIHILIPEMKDELDRHATGAGPAPPGAGPAPAGAGPASAGDAEPDFTFFDYVGIEDPRIAEFCAATSEPSPHAILRTCLLRNFGAGDRHIHTEMKKLEYQKIELTMRVGKHSATVVCKNKKQAKQRASQTILQALHPHITSWGSLLRLYGSRSVKSCKEKKLEEQQITLLQDKAQQNEPNHAVLEKLRNEMRKLKERDEAVVPIGTLLVADDLPTHSGSMLNNVDL